MGQLLIEILLKHILVQIRYVCIVKISLVNAYVYEQTLECSTSCSRQSRQSSRSRRLRFGVSDAVNRHKVIRLINAHSVISAVLKSERCFTVTDGYNTRVAVVCASVC